MIGLPGSGKTFFAEKFAETFNAPYISIESIGHHVSSTEAAKAIANLTLSELFKTNQSIILEGEGSARSERLELARKAKTAGYQPLLIWVQTDPITAKGRSVKPQKSQPAKRSVEEFDKESGRFTPPNTIEQPIVISGKHTYASQVKVVLKRLSTPRKALPPTPPPRESRSTRRNISIR